MSYNKITLVGNVGQDPEVKTFDNGGRIVRFTLATSERWKNKEGEKQEKTEWHNIQCNFDGLIGVIEKYVKKGDQLLVEGVSRSRSYEDKEGNKRSFNYVELKDMKMLGGGAKSESEQPSAPNEKMEASKGGEERSDGLPF